MGRLEYGSPSIWYLNIMTPILRIMETVPSKIDLLVAEAKAELERLGVKTEGKRSDELLAMAREHRNRARAVRPGS